MHKRSLLALVIAGVFAGPATAGFHIEYPAVVNTTERDLMSNRTHYEQKGEAAFRMNDATPEPMQERDKDSGAKLLVDLGYRVVTHDGTPNNEERVRTFADDVPLTNALALIVPRGWRVHQDKSLNDKRTGELVSFEGNMLWSDALFMLGERYGYQFHIRWQDRIVEAREGQPVATGGAGKIRVIDEPPKGQPVAGGWLARLKQRRQADSETASADTAAATKIDTKDSAQSGATAYAAPGSKGVVAANGQGAVGEDAKRAKDSAKEAKPVAPKFVLRVQKGTLHENIVRLSQENGWKAPRWNIESDYRVPTSYTLEGETFEAAIFKLLHIHPIEADINRNQKIIYVLREL